MSSDPHWLIIAVVGAGIGFLLRYIVYVPRFIWQYRHREPLEGKWLEYHTTFVGGKQIITEGVWTVRKGFLHKLTVRFQHKTGGTLKYKGFIYEERGHAIAVLKSTSHRKETVYYRFVNPIGSEHSIPGLWLSIDRGGMICSGSAILSREPIMEEEVIQEFKRLIDRSAKIPGLRVKQ